VVEVGFKSTLVGHRMSDQLLSISEVASLSAMASSALRYYERCGLIEEGVKIGGRRHYPASVLHRLSTIKACQKLGFSLTEITELLSGSLAREQAWRQAAIARRGEVERQIDQLQNLVQLIDDTLDCDCPALYECPQMGPAGHLAAADNTENGNQAFGKPAAAR
jgi:MerR family redox-sensitive transcriptional activator SoxR